MMKILVVLGPTATGKSDLAVTLAKKFNGEIISADSRQVYKSMDIGTGKITKKEMKGIPHYLLDVANPKNQFSVVKYVKLAQEKISDIARRNKLPIICGGTGFYIQALVDGIILPDVSADKNLREKLGRMAVQKLFNILLKLDPDRARNIDPKNARRIIRAIEIAKALGKVPKIKKIKGKYEPLFIGLNLSPDKLKQRIKIRLEKRIRIGMSDETRKLHQKGLSWNRLNELGLEYRYLALYFQKKISKEEMVQKLSREIWHYAKRQMTWFKKDKRIKWFEMNDYKIILAEIKKFLG